MDERYSIEVSDDTILIYGQISIEEAFDFLNFFEKKGFKSIDIGIDSSTLRFRRKSIEQVVEEEREAEHKSSEAFYEGLYEESKKQVEKLGQKIRQLENFIKELMQTEQEKYARLSKENEANRRAQMLINLKDNPEVQRIMQNQFPDRTISRPMTEEEKKEAFEKLVKMKNDFPHIPIPDPRNYPPEGETDGNQSSSDQGTIQSV